MIKAPSQNSLKADDLFNAVKAQDPEMINFIVSQGIDVNAKDKFGRTPLFFAQTKKVIDCLLALNANLFQTDLQQIDALTYMRLESRSPSIIDHLKMRIEFDKAKVENFHRNIKALLSNELKIAKEQGKCLLVILGDAHGRYPIYKAEKIISQVAQELGIGSLLGEVDKESIKKILTSRKEDNVRYVEKILRRAKNKLGMSVEGIDTLHEMGSKGIGARDASIQAEVLKRKKDAVLIIGGFHLKGLLKDKETTLSDQVGASKQYHIVPFNLASIVNTLDYGSSEYAKFLSDKDNVIQIGPSLTFSQAEASKAIARWNSGKVKPESVATPPSKSPLDKKEKIEFEALSKDCQILIELSLEKSRTNFNASSGLTLSMSEYWEVEDKKIKQELINQYLSTQKQEASQGTNPPSAYTVRTNFNELPKELQKYIALNLEKSRINSKLGLDMPSFWQVTDKKEKQELLDQFLAAEKASKSDGDKTKEPSATTTVRTEFNKLPIELQKYIKLNLEKSRINSKLGLDMPSFWQVADKKEKQELLDQFLATEKATDLDKTKKPSSTTIPSAIFNETLKCETSAWHNNCGLNCLTHFFAAKLENGDIQRLYDKDPAYNALLVTFKEYYGLEKNPAWKDIQALFESYPNPIDREYIFAPVLRRHLEKILPTHRDRIWDEFAGALDDYMTKGIVEGIAGALYASNQEIFHKLRVEYQTQVLDLMVPALTDAERKTARERIVRGTRTGETPNLTEERIVAQIRNMRNDDLRNTLLKKCREYWTNQGCERYAHRIGMLRNGVMISADHLQLLAENFQIGLTVFTEDGPQNLPKPGFRWPLKVYNGGLHWEYEEPGQNRSLAKTHNDYYELPVSSFKRGGSIEEEIIRTVKNMFQKAMLDVSSNYGLLSLEFRQFLSENTKSDRTRIKEIESVDCSTEQYWKEKLDSSGRKALLSKYSMELSKSSASHSETSKRTGAFLN